MTSGWGNWTSRQCSYTFTVFGSDNAPIKKLIDNAIVHTMEKDKEKVKIYERRWGDHWWAGQKKIPRSLDSVVLDGDKKAEVIKDILRF